MDILKLPYGPWKVLLAGTFEGYHVSIYQNPDRDVFTVVADKGPDGRVRGLVVMGYKAFKVDGPAESALGATERGVIVYKKKKGEDYRYLLIESSPKYISPSKEELSSAVETIFNALNKEKILVQKMAKSAGAVITPLKFASKREAAVLFSEPIVLPSMLPGMKPVEEELRAFPLGKTRQGEVMREPLIEMSRTIVTGIHGQARKKALAVMVENFSIGGIPVIIVTDDAGKYSKMKRPSDSDLHEYGITNVGFPVEVLNLGDGYGIDPNVIEPGEFAQVLGISKGVPCYQVLDRVLSEHRGEFEDMDAMLRVVGGNKFSEVQLSRVLKAFASVHGDFVKRNLPSEYLHGGDIGEITVLECKGDVYAKAGVLSVLRGIHRYLLKIGGKRIKVCVVVENAGKILGKKSEINMGIVDTMEKIAKTGGAFVIETESEAEIDEKILRLVETRVITASEDEIGVRMLTKRPYRVKIRPFASGITL